MNLQIETSSHNYHFSNRFALALSVLALATCLCACTRPDPKPAGPAEKITIAYSATHYALLADVAQVKGFFQKEGLEVTPRMHAYGKLALRDMFEGKADFATVAETPVMFAIMDGADISIISTINTTSKDNAIVARKDKGILTPNDLKGRKIAATFGTTSEFFMDAFLAVNGISRKDVEVVNLRQEELPRALAEGKTDAAAVFNPFLNASQKELGVRGTTFYNENLYTQSFNIVSTKEFVRHNPGKVGKVLRALDRAEKFVSQNPEEAFNAVADFNRMDIAAVREMLAGTDNALTLDQSLLLAMEDESRWAIKAGLTGNKKVPNYLDFIYFEGLKSVKPDAVRILR
jgi:NitT/TauT family transport system substrate-binding protein